MGAFELETLISVGQSNIALFNASLPSPSSFKKDSTDENDVIKVGIERIEEEKTAERGGKEHDVTSCLSNTTVLILFSSFRTDF